MKNMYRDSIVRALMATEVQRGLTYLWFGRRFGALPSSVKRRIDDATARNHLLLDLQARLYRLFYCVGEATPSNLSYQRHPEIPLGPELQRANQGRGYWGQGWQVRSFDPQSMTFMVRRGSLTLHVSAKDCTALEAGFPPPEAMVSVRFQKDLPNLSPGFYMALGDNELKQDEPSGTLRLYWNLTASGAVSFVQRTTKALNRAELPFTLKALDDAAQYRRCDAVVLYLRKDDFRQAAEILQKIHRALETSLRPATPALTKRIAAGVGAAESPPSGLSFGMSRCRALAEAMLRAHETHRISIDDRLQSVAECFAEDGFDFASPYLNLGSLDQFEFGSRPRRRPTQDTALEAHTSAECLKAAAEIGRVLAQQAIWHGDRCNWVGAELVPDSARTSSHFNTVYKTLPSDMYSGTSGVALFMAELAVLTGDSEIRRTALGAIRHALTSFKSVPQAKRLGFYSGLIGIACAAARIGRRLGEESPLTGAAQLLAHLECTNRTGREFDLMAGKAGAIVGLLRIRHDLKDAVEVNLARQLGNALLRTVEHSSVGCSWRSHTFSYRHNLTGLSHGTAGVAYALLELYHETEQASYLRAAEDALRYERRFFNSDVGNWPDFREESVRPRRKDPQSYKTSWCHGAPGIALSRLRAYQITGNDVYREEADVALNTTRAAIIASMESRRFGYALCHGLPGNADVLLSGCRVLGSARMDDLHLARQAAGAISRFRGMGDIESPSLMLGLAGVGYFYLRLCDAEIPSVLWGSV
ncbi:lanthionine synthetase LanC family protein [Catellatospora paridis]|uniref:lanthionine synthetase LanC family protein n=1 Tax=Catellatospora paridis TaxID=1617086 RepID=UPI0012D40E2D|nr:lanthionine synthetase LanC family protein [Catellatospora paridis]